MTYSNKRKNITNKKIMMKIKREDTNSRNPFWKVGSFKRVHKNKKKYNRKDNPNKIKQ